jgi:predicted RNase H-like HicB family nuclease
MMTTLSVPVEITAVVHEIEGGGNWAEVPCFPGCIAQAETWRDLRRNLLLAIGDWLAETQVKTEDEAKQLAAIQGRIAPVDRSFPEPYDYLPPPSWNRDTHCVR